MLAENELAVAGLCDEGDPMPRGRVREELGVLKHLPSVDFVGGVGGRDHIPLLRDDASHRHGDDVGVFDAVLDAEGVFG